MTAKRASMWARLKAAGARANGLSEADAVEESVCGVDDRDDADTGRSSSYRGSDGESRVGAKAAEGAGGEQKKGDELAVSGAPREGKQLVLEDAEAFQEWDFWHGGRSVVATIFAGLALGAVSVLGPDGLRLDYVAVGAGLYAIWFTTVFAAMCWDCRRGRASLPDRSREVRIALGVLALLLLWSGETVAAGLAGWFAAAAFALGGAAEGGFMAAISLRREVSPWRALLLLFRNGDRAWRQCWRVMYGGAPR